MTAAPPVDYVLPLKWTDEEELADLTAYLRGLVAHARVIVVDGSPPRSYERHAAAWAGLVTHVRPDPLGYANGKVEGVTTGLRLAAAERVVIADDDVRYDPAALSRVVAALDEAHLVGPQNVFDPMPWHARWDTARSLLNRAFGADYPGTYAIRRATWEAMGGYDGNVLFENLELMRTVAAWGGRVRRPLDVYVRRHPPTVARFRSQRVRQAYDDLAQPGRLAVELAVLPAALVALARRRPLVLLAGALATVALAETGRRRAGGRAAFPASASWFAPLWVMERAGCVWVAVGLRVARGGVSYGGRRLRVAAHSRARLRRRLRSRVPYGLAAVDARRGPEAGDLVGAVAERLECGPAAAAQRDGAPAGVDLHAVRVDEPDGAPYEQRPVPVGRDGDGLVATGRGARRTGRGGCHGAADARRPARQTPAEGRLR